MSSHNFAHDKHDNEVYAVKATKGEILGQNIVFTADNAANGGITYVEKSNYLITTDGYLRCISEVMVGPWTFKEIAPEDFPGYDAVRSSNWYREHHKTQLPVLYRILDDKPGKLLDAAIILAKSEELLALRYGDKFIFLSLRNEEVTTDADGFLTLDNELLTWVIDDGRSGRVLKKTDLFNPHELANIRAPYL